MTFLGILACHMYKHSFDRPIKLLVSCQEKNYSRTNTEVTVMGQRRRRWLDHSSWRFENLSYAWEYIPNKLANFGLRYIALATSKHTL